MNAHRNMQFAKLPQKGCDLIDAQNIGHEQKSQRINSVDQKWAELDDLVKQKQEVAGLVRNKLIFQRR